MPVESTTFSDLLTSLLSRLPLSLIQVQQEQEALEEDKARPVIELFSLLDRLHALML